MFWISAFCCRFVNLCVSFGTIHQDKKVLSLSCCLSICKYLQTISDRAWKFSPCLFVKVARRRGSFGSSPWRMSFTCGMIAVIMQRILVLYQIRPAQKDGLEIHEMRKTYLERTEWQKPTWLNSLTSPSLPSDFQKMKKPNSSTLKAWRQDPGHYQGGDGDSHDGDDEVDKEGGGGGRWQSFEKQGCRENCFSGPFNDPFEYLWPSDCKPHHRHHQNFTWL